MTSATRCLPAPDHEPRLLWWLAALMAGIWMLPALLLPPDVTRGAIMAFGDAACFYCAGLRSAAGLPVYGASIFECFTNTPFLHPPVSLFIFQPWALLPLRLAIVAYYLAQFWALGVISTTLWRLAGVSAWPRAGQYVFIGSVLLADSITLNLIVGQVNLLAFALALATIRRLEQKQEGAAGACLLLAALLKPYFIILGLMLLPGRHYRALLVALAGGLALCLLSLAWSGLQPWREFMAFNAQYMSLQEGVFMQQPWVQRLNVSLLAFLQRLGLAYDDAVLGWKLLLAPLLGLGLYAFYRLWQARAAPMACLALLLSGLCVMLPFTWPFYLPWLLPAALLAARHPRAQAGTLLLFLIPWGWMGKTLTPDFLLPLPLLLLALYLATLRRSLHPAKRTAETP